MTAQEMAELKAELLAELRAEQERKDRNRSTFKKVMEPFEKELDEFDWTETVSGTRPDGSTFEWKDENRYGYALRSGIGALLRALYQVKTVSALPSEKEEEMRQFIAHILSQMNSYRSNTKRQHEQTSCKEGICTRL